MNARRSIPLALLAAATAVLATACAATTTTPGAAGTAGSSAPAAAPSQSTGAQPITDRSGTPAPTAGKGRTTGGTGGTGGTGSTGSGNGNSDSYAFKHPCDPGQVSVDVQYQHSVGDTRRIIVVTNHGSTACGLSYFPTVSIADSRSVGPNSHPTSFTTPKVPGGLGGAPYTALHAGRSAYAVLDLDPSHSTAGAVQKYDELDVKASDFMPDAATTNHAVRAQPADSGNPYVKAPVLSLYYATVADAVAQAGNPADYK